ncbi:hypothetical protein ACFY3J_38020 [Streptomyces sp. NPDC001231]|uniref:hypothetical protein n=1 Tax=Streptomyces sp. NPDC001231 TaxID=3364549 RepID=UPI0036B66631
MPVSDAIPELPMRLQVQKPEPTPEPAMSAVAEPGRAGLVTIGLDAARALFSTAEASGFGRPGTDEIFDQWLDSGFDVAFYRNADRPLQARAVSQEDRVPESLTNSPIGEAWLESVCLNPRRLAPVEPREPDPVSAEGEEADGTDARTGAGMPGNRWGDEEDKRRYAKVEYQDDGCVLTVVGDFTEGTGKESAYHLGGEITSYTGGDWFETLSTLTELAQARLEMEGWTPDGQWQIRWSSSVCDVTNPPNGTIEVFEQYGFDPDEITQHYVCIYSQGSNGYTVEFIAEHRGEDHVMYLQLGLDPGSEEPGRGSLEELRSHLEQATERVREAGYTTLDGDWTVHWTRCHVPLAEL